MEDSDSDEEETSMPRLMGSVGRARNVYRNTSKKIIQGSDDARDVSPKAFCASTYKSGTGVLHSTGLGGVMVASAVRGGLARVQFLAKPSGDSANADPRNPTAGATSSRPTSFPPPAPAPRHGLFSSLFRKSQAPLEDQDLEE